MTDIGDSVSECPNGTYRFDGNFTCLKYCPSNYEINEERNKCIIKSYKQTSSNEFKNQILSNITSFVNSSALINGSDFIAMIFPADEVNPKDQLKNGISAIDLGNCTKVIKEHYNISQTESLIVVNMESKKNKTNENSDNSFNIGKNIQMDIYDNSGRKLNLLVCKQDIKVLVYLGNDIEELNIESAMDLADQWIDIFNPSDEFFNDICHYYDNKEGKDIIINDRRTDIYQNAIFVKMDVNMMVWTMI